MRRMTLALATSLLSLSASSSISAQETATAVFAGGCFWCVEADFDKVEGVSETISGYTGGTLENPTYQDVVAGGTGHYEAVQVVYDPAVVSYEELLTAFWHSVDPLDAGGQFCDRGDSYRTAIFVEDEAQRAAAEASRQAVAADLATEGEIVTEILDAGPFYPAEDYHQAYYQTNAVQYNFYRFRCGRDGRISEVWGDTAFLGLK